MTTISYHNVGAFHGHGELRDRSLVEIGGACKSRSLTSENRRRGKSIHSRHKEGGSDKRNGLHIASGISYFNELFFDVSSTGGRARRDGVDGKYVSDESSNRIWNIRRCTLFSFRLITSNRELLEPQRKHDPILVNESR
jgi:hypothetical protein